MTRAFSKTGDNANTEGLSFSLRTLRMLIYLTLIGPLLITFIFVDELAFNMLAQYLSFQTWQLVRLIPVVLFALVRVAMFRDEVQFQFDQSYFLVSKMM